MGNKLDYRLVYFYRRENEYGYDQLSIIAWSKEQADTMLKEVVKNPEQWHYNHLINLDAHLYDDD